MRVFLSSILIRSFVMSEKSASRELIEKAFSSRYPLVMRGD
jgi:hypothetical protein